MVKPNSSVEYVKFVLPIAPGNQRQKVFFFQPNEPLHDAQLPVIEICGPDSKEAVYFQVFHTAFCRGGTESRSALKQNYVFARRGEVGASTSQSVDLRDASRIAQAHSDGLATIQTALRLRQTIGG